MRPTRAQLDHRATSAAAFFAGAFFAVALVGLVVGWEPAAVGVIALAATVLVIVVAEFGPARRQETELATEFAKRVLERHGLTCELRRGALTIGVNGRYVEILALDDREAASGLIDSERLWSRAGQLAPWSAGGPH